MSGQKDAVGSNRHLSNLIGNVQVKSDAGDMCEYSNSGIFYSKHLVSYKCMIRYSAIMNGGSIEIIENYVVQFGLAVQAKIANCRYNHICCNLYNERILL